jgi:zinc protease
MREWWVRSCRPILASVTTVAWLVFSLPGALSCAGKPSAPPAASVAGVAAAPSAAAPRTDEAARDDLPLPTDPAAHLATLPNGLRTYVRAHREPQKRAQLRLVVNAGSVLEEEGERGLAHFVEHMAFNGTRLFKKQEIVDFMEKIGMRFGQHANAYTGLDETVYTFEVPTDDAAILERSFLMLQQLASEVSFEPHEVDRERGVVIEEWRLGLGAQMRVTEQLFPVLFKDSRYAERLPIGKKAVLEKASAADLQAFYRRWYRPDLMAVIAVGDFDVATIEGHIRKHFAPLAPAAAGAPPRPSFPVPDHAETLVSIAKDKELTATSVGVLYKLPSRRLSSRRDYRRATVERIYHRMVNARLEELSRVPDPPFLGAGSITQPFVRTKDIFIQSAVTKAEGIARGLESLTREVARIDRHGFTAGELEREKAATLRDIERAVREKDKSPSAGLAEEMVRNFLTDESMPGVERELELTREFLPTITLAEMNRVASEWISERNRVITVQAPAVAPCPTPAELRAVFARTLAGEIGPYVDKVGSTPLLPKLPPPGKIVREKEIPEIGVTEWRLSNGIRVLIKPTDFKNDEILLQGFSPGGHSRVPDRDFESASYAAGVIAAGGLGTFGPTELRKALTAKVVSLSPYINELEEGVSGGASPDDLETLFGLIHLTVTAPRRDPEVFAAYREQLREQLTRRQAQPEAVFADRWLEVYYRNHLRRRTPDPGVAERISLDTMYRIYRERFADLSDSTFVLVGRLDNQGLRPLVEQYLATLPTRRRKESFRDVGVHPIGGVHRFTVSRGEEPKSQVRMTFNGPARWSREAEHRTASLGEALSIRLREALREDLGGTYSVAVAGYLIRKPLQRYRSEIRFGCAPENADKLLDAVKAELALVKAKGPAAEIVEKVRTGQSRALEEALRTNGYWLGMLADHARHGTDVRLILEEKKLIDALDVRGLQDAARRSFAEERLVVGVLEPAVSPTVKPIPPGKVGLAPSR